MSGSYLAFAQAQLIDKFGPEAGYHEFLRRRGMSLGLFTLPVGAVDRQHPHMADEVYIVLEGKGTLQVVDDKVPVEAGSIVSVDHGEEHHFVDVVEDLRMLVVFAPPDLPDEDED